MDDFGIGFDSLDGLHGGSGGSADLFTPPSVSGESQPHFPFPPRLRLVRRKYMPLLV